MGECINYFGQVLSRPSSALFGDLLSFFDAFTDDGGPFPRLSEYLENESDLSNWVDGQFDALRRQDAANVGMSAGTQRALHNIHDRVHEELKADGVDRRSAAEEVRDALKGLQLWNDEYDPDDHSNPPCFSYRFKEAIKCDLPSDAPFKKKIVTPLVIDMNLATGPSRSPLPAAQPSITLTWMASLESDKKNRH